MHSLYMYTKQHAYSLHRKTIIVNQYGTDCLQLIYHVDGGDNFPSCPLKWWAVCDQLVYVQSHPWSTLSPN